MATMRQPIESGVPDNKPFLHPLMLKNYGNWNIICRNWSRGFDHVQLHGGSDRCCWHLVCEFSSKCDYAGEQQW